MGYTTDFEGSFTIKPPLNAAGVEELKNFSETRHDGPVGPGVWCDWVASEDGTELAHNGNEKFYHYCEWLTYLVNNFFRPRRRKLSGSVTWQGEQPDDMGRIVFNADGRTFNTQYAHVTYR